MSDVEARRVMGRRFAAAHGILALAGLLAISLMTGCERRETTTVEADREEYRRNARERLERSVASARTRLRSRADSASP